MRFRWALILLECDGMDVKTLSAMLGHMSAATTLDIYTHVTNDMQRATARKDLRAYARGMQGEAEGIDYGDESGAGGVEAAEGEQLLIG